jgi:TonB family protein
MRLLKTALTAALFALASDTASGAAVRPPAPVVIAQPDWITKPDAATMAAAYPPLAVTLELAGQATISCRVDSFGRLQACQVVSETPKGIGFGAAGLSVARAFHMRPMSVNGTPVDGGTVRVPLRFQLPPSPGPLRLPEPRSARALELSRRLLDLDTGKDASALQYEKAARALEFVPRPDVSDEPRIAIAQALRQSYPPRLVELHETSARLYAGTFSEAELTQLIAYYSNPAGLGLVKEGEDYRAMSAMIRRESNRVAIARAQEVFCAIHECARPDDILGVVRDASGDHPTVGIAMPSWIQQPTYEEITRATPFLAKTLQLGGAVRMTCTVASQGIVGNCAIANETPRGLGFGEAAQTLKAYYRLSPALLDQGAVGETVAVMLRFEAPKAYDGVPFTGVKARSARALTLAKDVIAARDPGDRVRTAWIENMEKQWREHPIAGVTKADWDAAMRALVAGSEKAKAAEADMHAAYQTTRLTDAQLIAGAQFWRGPGGRAWTAKFPELQGQMQDLVRAYYRLIWADAGRVFCQARECVTPIVVAPKKP